MHTLIPWIPLTFRLRHFSWDLSSSSLTEVTFPVVMLILWRRLSMKLGNKFYPPFLPLLPLYLMEMVK